MSSPIEDFKLSLKPEPLKSFIKKGISNQDGSFTDDGKLLFDEFLKNKFETEFNKDVVSKIKLK